ncbi:hypothetical protein [Fibrella aestuarina]|nr:hypothetical protein [Fibrella aestuarina]
MHTAQLLEDSLLVVWNDRDADRRLDAMKKIYAPAIHFYESNAGEAIVGHQAINELISTLQAEWPIDFQFVLNKPSQVNHQLQFISWELGPQGAEPVASGMDIAVVENDLIQSLHLFLDAPEKAS